MEVPWVDRPPFEIVRDQVRLTAQPLDGPVTREAFERFMEQMGSDRLLLFASDYPHWQFDGDDAVPDVVPPALARKLQFDNPRETYPRLVEAQS
jgi:predicted TIM-barrel fold metal-dependent hydrolase